MPHRSAMNMGLVADTTKKEQADFGSFLSLFIGSTISLDKLEIFSRISTTNVNFEISVQHNSSGTFLAVSLLSIDRVFYYQRRPPDWLIIGRLVVVVVVVQRCDDW